MKKRDKSPCVDVCRYSSHRGWCVACGMTRKESKSWKAMKPYGKVKLSNELHRRQAELKKLNLSEA